MINSLQSLRGIFAIFIFFHHIQYNSESLFPAGGPCGVAFFFILSGFVMCAGYEKKIDGGIESKTQLFLRRIIRVYPLHLLCLSCMILLSFRVLDLNYFIKLIPNLLLLQSWIPIQSVYFSGNALSWCLCDLMFFYFVFPFFMILIEKQKKVFFNCIILITLIYLCGVRFIPKEYLHGLIYINPVFRSLDFMIGITLWQLWLMIKSRNIPQLNLSSICTRSVNLIEIGSIAIIILTLVMSEYIPKVYWFDAYWWIPTGILILVFTFFNNRGGVLDILLNNKYLVLFGNVSFSFYMIHLIGLSILNSIYHHMFGSYNVWLTILPSFVIISIVSYFIYKYYETPVSNYFIKLLKHNKREKSYSI